MATRRGPKLEPKEINKYKVVVDKLPEKPQAQVFEMEEIKENLEKFHNVDAEVEINEIKEEIELIAEDEFITSEAAKVPHFDFQDEYHFGPGNGDAIIDALPQPQKRKKRIDELNQTELRMFHKTGFMPEI